MIATFIKRLLLLAGAMAAAGILFIFFDSDGTTFAERGTRVIALAERSFGSGQWNWLLRATGVSAAIALMTTLASWLADRPKEETVGAYAALDSGNVRDRVREVARRLDALLGGSKADVVRALDELIRGAIAVEASDIHMSPSGEGFRLVYRVHGTLYPVATLDLAHAPRLSTRIKVLARLDTYVRGTPQDGRLVTTIDGVIVEARVSTLPTESGERVVLRFVRGSRSVPALDALGFSPNVEQRLKELLARPQGLLFLAAPVGSGKTTTLYAALKHIAATRGTTTTLVTLEDPIELELPFATQTQMHRRAGMTFASTLRSVLRQDPNVLMIGEIRDPETADIAMQAGLTGHLILTTVHGDGAAGPFARLIDMGMEPFVLASASIGCLSQRLVRTLCTACRKASIPEPLIVQRLEELQVKLPVGTYYEPVGCDFCEGAGFTGRVPIAELLVVTSRMRSAVNERQTTERINQLALDEGMIPLVVDGIERAARGETSLAEVVRVAG